ncbi:MAG: hypothetical protein R3E79_48715 [Caldilineaceae bacterium]
MLPVAARETEQALMAEPKFLDTFIAEQTTAEAHVAEVAATQMTTLGDIPLIVLQRAA